MKIETHPRHDRQWTLFVIHQQNYTLGHLLLPYLQKALPFAACNMKHPLESRQMELLLHAPPEQARLALQQACKDAHAELERGWTTMRETFSAT